MGNLTFVNYPASPDITFAYDPLNRCTNMVDVVGTTRYSFTTGGEVLTEDGPFASDTVTYTYANRLRAGLSLEQPSGVWTNGFGYDAARRLSAVSSPAGSFGYDFSVSGVVLPGSLIRRVTLPNTSYITNTFDAEARLTGTWLKKSDHTVLDAATYGYNAGHQRTTYTNATGTNVSYAYDAIGQLRVADSAVNAEDRGYFYDTAWNLNRRTNNGTTQTFQVDTKNQLTNALTKALSYDDNGNITTNAIYTYNWDDENRLVMIEDTFEKDGATFRTEFVYDGLGRMRERIESGKSSGHMPGSLAPLGPGDTWTVVARFHYVYDGHRVIQERQGTANLPLVSYTRGTDLSGSLEGAGGIGGLLARSHGYGTGGTWATHNYYHSDGNGNITYLVSSSQTLAASYRYDPYGNLISKSGTLADANLYRFSSKELHLNSGLYYYLYRFYNPNLQRWINRDPVGERFGINVFAFVESDPVGRVDPLGQDYYWGAYNACANECSRQFDKCFLSVPAIAKPAGGVLFGLLCVKRLNPVGALASGAYGLLTNLTECDSAFFGCMSGCPPKNPYPMPPPGSGCSLCPVNAPPIFSR